MSKLVRRPTTVYLDRGLRLWIMTTARKNFWRVASWYDLADLVQDGYMCYAVCLRKYGDKVDGPGHFCSLVKTTFRNHITDLSNTRSNIYDAGLAEVPVTKFKMQGNVTVTDQTKMEVLAGENASVVGDAELVAALSRASVELRALMQAVTTGVPVGKILVTRTRLTTNEWLNTLVGTIGHNYEFQLRRQLGLPLSNERPSLGYTYSSESAEVRRAARVCADRRLSPRDRRRIHSVQNYQFRYLPAGAVE